MENGDATGGAAAGAGTFMRRITKFTVFATLIQWLVNRPPQGNIQVQKATEYLRLMRTKKHTEKDKFCIKQCERK